MNKDIHINPDDDSTTVIQVSTDCCKGYHQTIPGAILKSDEWKRWYNHASKHMLYDVDETESLGLMSDKHWNDFIKYIKNEK